MALDCARDWLVDHGLPVVLAEVVMGYARCFDGIAVDRRYGHAGGVLCMVSLGHHLLATGSDDQMIRIWDMSAIYKRCVVHGHEGAIHGLDVLVEPNISSGSDDPACIALVSGSADTTVRLWRVVVNVDQTNRKNHPVACTQSLVLRGHTNGVMGVAGMQHNMIGSCSWDQTVRIWQISDNLRAGVCLHVLVHPCGLTAMAWNGWDGWNIWNGMNIPNGSDVSIGTDVSIGMDVPNVSTRSSGRLVVGGFDGTFWVWGMGVVARSVARLRGHSLCVSSIVFMANHIIVTGSYDSHIRLWDNRYECIWILEGHRGYVLGLVVLDDQRVVSCSADTTLRIWDTAPRMGKTRGKPYNTWNRMIRGKRAPPIVIHTPHTQWICCIEAIDSMVISGSDDASMCRWI
jgi:WD40 repeat protein